MTDLGGSRESLETQPKVKICGLTRREDALLAAEAGADFLGVVLVAGTPRCLAPGEARRILEGIPLPAVAVMADLAVAGAVSVARETGAAVVQLHGEETPDMVSEIRNAGPWRVWKALRVREARDVEAGLELYGDVADGLLMDAWHPCQKGGTGQAFSWEAVASLQPGFPARLTRILAGGLTPENVEEAVKMLRPHVVDVSSGVERRPGIKDRKKVGAFIRSVRMVGEGGIR
jgi:phosphoribosylanthranilate isomerase